MTDAQKELLMLKGYIADLEPADRQGVHLAATKIREVLAQHNDHGRLALALIAAEMASEIEG